MTTPTQPYLPVPVRRARDICELYAKDWAIVLAFDGVFERLHVATYGMKPKDKLRAAELGERIAVAAGGDLSKAEVCADFRLMEIATLKARIDDLERQLQAKEAVP